MLWSVTLSATLTSNPIQGLRSQRMAAIWASLAATKDRAERRLWAENANSQQKRTQPSGPASIINFNPP